MKTSQEGVEPGFEEVWGPVEVRCVSMQGHSHEIWSSPVGDAAKGSGIEACSADYSVQSTGKIFFAFIFGLSGWALMAPLCFED